MIVVIATLFTTHHCQCCSPGLSLLERLMKDNPLYQKSADSGHFDTRFVTKLLRNYRCVFQCNYHFLYNAAVSIDALYTSCVFLSSHRSHAAILKIPNELFYENELQVFADQWDREAYCNWEHLPKKVSPQGHFILFF